MRLVLTLTLLAALGALAAGCGEEDEAAREPVLGGPPGEVFTVAGSEPAASYLNLGAANFTQEVEERVEVRRLDPEQAIRALCEGDVPIAGTAPVTEREAPCPDGPEITSVPLAHHAVAVAANPQLEIDCLTVDQLRRLWGTGGETPPEVDGRDVRLYGAAPNTPPHRLFRQDVLDGAEYGEYVPVDDERVLIDRVQTDANALGFFTFEEIDQAEPQQVDIVAVDGGDGCVQPTDDAVQSGRWPIYEQVMLFARASALDEEQTLASFARFLLANNRQIGKGSPDVTMLTDEQAREALETLPDAPVPAG